MKDGNIQLGGASLQTGGLLGQQKGNIELGNSGKIQSLEIKGTHESKGGSEQSSEENKEDGKCEFPILEPYILNTNTS